MSPELYELQSICQCFSGVLFVFLLVDGACVMVISGDTVCVGNKLHNVTVRC